MEFAHFCVLYDIESESYFKLKVEKGQRAEILIDYYFKDRILSSESTDFLSITNSHEDYSAKSFPYKILRNVVIDWLLIVRIILWSKRVKTLLNNEGIKSACLNCTFKFWRNIPSHLVIVKSFLIAYRLFLYQQNDCLFQSIALWSILKSAKIEAHLILGICAHPFHAHAWVEHNGFILTDSILNTSKFQKIISLGVK